MSINRGVISSSIDRKLSKKGLKRRKRSRATTKGERERERERERKRTKKGKRKRKRWMAAIIFNGGRIDVRNFTIM